MALTSPEEIRDALLQAYDPARVEGLYRKAVYAFGGSRKNATVCGVGRIVECPDIVVDYLEIGQSRRILNTALISLSGTMYAQPSPEFQGIDKHTAEIRRQFLLKRGDGDDDGGSEWADEDEMAYLDGDGLGFGGVQICLKTNPATGLQRVSVEHVPAFHVIHDRHARGFGRSRLVAFVKYIAPYEFAKRFGEQKRAECETFLFDESLGSGFGEALRVCRVVEYYDVGLGGTEPTRAILMNDLDGEILEHEANSFERLPFAHFSYWHPTGSRHPLGRIDSQMGTHEALNEVERTIRRQTKKQGVGLFDTDVIDADDLEAWNDGEADYVRFDGTRGKTPYYPVQGQEVTNTTLQWQQSLERQFTTDSGQTDLDRGNQLDQTKTLGEAQLLVGRSQSQGSRSALQALRYHRRKYQAVLDIARKFDRDPLEIDFNGHGYTLNDPESPNASLDNWLREPARILISEDAMRFQDQLTQQAQKSQQLMALGDLVQAGVVPLPWWAEQRLEAMGYDPKEAMGGTTAQSMMAGGMGDPNAQGMQPGANGAAAEGLPGLAR